MNTQSKVIFWNIWGHRLADGVHDFLEHHSHDTDVFCLTEVRDVDSVQLSRLGTNLRYSRGFGEQAEQMNGYQQLRERFSDTHALHYISATRDTCTCDQNRVKFKDSGFGSTLMVKSDLVVIDHGHELLEFDGEDVKSRVLQWVVYTKGETCYLLAHLHGAWIKGNTKGDHEVRNQQALLVRVALIRIANMYDVEKVIFGGDFNLDINTNALQLMEGDHYRNLIKEFGIENTRTAAYRNFDVEGESMYADYALVSNNVTVHSFAVADGVLASDHAALVVEFS